MAFWHGVGVWITRRRCARPEHDEVGQLLALLAEAEHDRDLHRRLVWSLALGLPPRRLPADERRLLARILKGDDL